MVITVAHQKGGVGKSTIAWHLAHTMKPDLIIDLDDQQTITAFNNIRSASGGKMSLPVISPCDRELMKLLTASDDRLILIDTGGFDSESNRLAIAGADLVIIPFADTPAEVLGLERLRKILNEIEASTGEVVNHACLINKAHPQRRNFNGLHQTMEYIGLNYFQTVIPTHDQHIGQSCGAGLSVHESCNRRHPVSKAFTDLKQEIAKRN
jgi:chromosome partitioning protein